MNTTHHFADKKQKLAFLNEKPSSSLIEEISDVQANDGITHYYYIKDNPERIERIFEEGERFIVYLDQNKIAAFLALRLIPHLIDSQRLAAQIRFIEVDKMYKGHGIATKLVHFALVIASCSGAEYVLSFVESVSDKEGFLKKLGCIHIFNDPYYYEVDNNYKPASAWLFPRKEITIDGIPELQKPITNVKSESIHYYKNDNRVLVTKFNNVQDLKSFQYERLYLHQECENSENVANYKIITDGFGILYEFIN